jgi:hypothetical protein
VDRAGRSTLGLSPIDIKQQEAWSNIQTGSSSQRSRCGGRLVRNTGPDDFSITS